MLGHLKPQFTSVLIDPFENFQMKRGDTIAGPKWYVLCGSWRNSDGVNCEVSLAFDSEINLLIHRNIVGSFVNNLLRYRNGVISAANSEGDQLRSETPSTRADSDSDNVDFIHYEQNYIERARQEPSTSASVATNRKKIDRSGHQRRFSVKRCMRGFAWFK